MNQLQMIIEQAKTKPEGLTLKLGLDNAVNGAIAQELTKAGLTVAFVTITGNQPGLHVQAAPSAIMEKLEVLENFSLRELPRLDDELLLVPKHSGAIRKMRWTKDALFVVWNSKEVKEYEYPHVPRELMEEAIELAESNGSLGSFVNEKIKPFYSTN